MRGPFGDPDALADVPQANARVTGDADQHLGVVSEKRPTRCRARVLVLSHRYEHSISRLIFHAILVRYSREDPKIPSHHEEVSRCSLTHAAGRSAPPLQEQRRTRPPGRRAIKRLSKRRTRLARGKPPRRQTAPRHPRSTSVARRSGADFTATR